MEIYALPVNTLFPNRSAEIHEFHIKTKTIEAIQ